MVFIYSYGDQVNTLPPPEIESQGFFQGLSQMAIATWCPVKQTIKPWIDVVAAKRVYMKTTQVCKIM